MKIEIKQHKEEISPVTLQLIFTTKEELDFFTALCNYRPIIDLAASKGIDLLVIRDAFGGFGGDPSITKLHAAISGFHKW